MKNEKWVVDDFAEAMQNAVNRYANPKLLMRQNSKILFNGFWRDGDKSNVCMWPGNATWHDAKTGVGGGCKEFAKTAFNMTLPDFMKRFSDFQSTYTGSTKIDVGEILEISQNNLPSKPLHLIWSEINTSSINNSSSALNWFKHERGFTDIDKFVGSGFASLEEKHVSCFDERHRKFIRYRLNVGHQLMVPLRSSNSDSVKNFVFRTITPCDKSEKTCLLPEAGGWSDPDGSPRAFGFPHLFMDFPHLVLCEGMADYFAAECLLQDSEKLLPLGAANADALGKWAQWLVDRNYSGHVTLIYHLDKDEHGLLSNKSIGPRKALQSLATFRKNGLKAHLFDWPTYIENITTHHNEIKDLADCLKAEATHRECGPGHLPYLFSALLKFEERF